MPEDNNQSFMKPKPQPADTSVRYIGKYAKVRVPEWEEQGWIEQGEVIEVPAVFAERLCEQPANWEMAKTKTKTKTKPVEGSAEDDTPEEE